MPVKEIAPSISEAQQSKGSVFDTWKDWAIRETAGDPFGGMATVLGGGVTPPALEAGAVKKMGKMVQDLWNTKRIPVAEEAKDVATGALHTPGQPSPEDILGTSLYWAQQAEAQHTPKTAAAKKSASDLKRTLKKESTVKPDFEEGQFQSPWYVGAYPELKKGTDEIWKVAPSGLIDKKNDAALIGKFIAATSPRSDPSWNVSNALRAYVKFLKSDRDPKYDFSGYMGSYRQNLIRGLRGEPLEGLKVSNFLLDIFGSEKNPTIDRWMANELLGKPTTAANMLPYEYQVVADRLTELSIAFGTTPVRAQAAMWTGSKLLRDDRIKSLMTKGLSKEQAVPALREVIAMKMDELRQRVSFDPRIITPSVALGAVMLDQANAENAAEQQQ